MSIPTVSVVMSVYNGERFLDEAVDSILGQSFEDFEFIIIDDGSTDSTGPLLDSYRKRDPRVRVFHQENRGLVASLNRGCEAARGKYIARMDADDIAAKDRLSWQLKFMEGHPKVGVVGGAIEFIDITGKSLRTSVNPAEDRDLRMALPDCPFWHPTVFMRKEIITLLGGYRKIVTDAEDHDLWLRVAEHYQLANLEKVVLKYRLHPYQVTVRKFRQMVTSSLAAQGAAASRKNGNPDPLDAATTITPKILAELGITEADLEAAVTRKCLWSIQTMCETGDYATAFATLLELFKSSAWRHAERRVVSDLYLFAAQLYWRQGRFMRSIKDACHAAIIRPEVLGRPLKQFLRWLRCECRRIRYGNFLTA